jgi:acyl-CoA synthetase (AMP-forming)/AMP-acid ligase II
MRGVGLLDRLAERSASNPTAIAIEHERESVSREEFVGRARRLARGFVAAGLEPGDRVLFAVRPTPASLAMILGIVEAGGVLVPASIGAGQSVFDAQMALVNPRWVVAEAGLLAASRSRLTRRVARWRGADLPSLERLRAATFVRVGRGIPGAAADHSLASLEGAGSSMPGTTSMPELAAEDPLLVVFTSGTTTAPKAALHSGRSMRATLAMIGERLDILEADVLYARDLHLILPALFAGAKVVMPSTSPFSPSKMVRALARHRVTHVFAVTAECQELLGHLHAHRKQLSPTLRHVLIGAAPVHTGFLRRFAGVLPPGATAWCVYGMTEILPVSCVTLADKLAYAGDGDCVGTPIPGVHVWTAADGELMVSGPNLFSGYVGQPPVREHATGDLARIDGGCITLLGRKKDMIIRGQHNIYPELHEQVIERITGVRRCAMVGVFDSAAADERVVLFVEPEDGCDTPAFERRLRRELRDGDARIDAAAQPDRIVLMSLPESGRSRKVDKLALREVARVTLGCA